MRSLLSILLLPLALQAQQGLRSPAVVGTLRSAGIPLLVNETFEGAGTPAGWTPTGTPDFDNTVAPLSGSQDLLLAASLEKNAYVTISAAPELFIRCEFKTSTTGNGNSLFFIGGAVDYVGVLLNSGDLQLTQDGAAVGAATVDEISAATKYWVFIHVLKGTGANAVLELEFSTTSTRTGSGNKFTSYTTGTLDENLTYFQAYHAAAAGYDQQVDNVVISTVGWP